MRAPLRAGGRAAAAERQAAAPAGRPGHAARGDGASSGASGRDARLLIAGSGEAEAALQRAGRARSASAKRVRFLGLVPNDEVARAAGGGRPVRAVVGARGHAHGRAGGARLRHAGRLHRQPGRARAAARSSATTWRWCRARTRRRWPRRCSAFAARAAPHAAATAALHRRALPAARRGGALPGALRGGASRREDDRQRGDRRRGRRRASAASTTTRSSSTCAAPR